MKEQHDFHRDLDPTTRHGHHNVVLDLVSQGEITAGYREIEQEQH